VAMTGSPAVFCHTVQLHCQVLTGAGVVEATKHASPAHRLVTSEAFLKSPSWSTMLLHRGAYLAVTTGSHLASQPEPHRAFGKPEPS
jgi:hypothetical protein